MVSGSCIYSVYCYQELIPLHKLFMGIRHAREALFVWGGMGSHKAAGNLLVWVPWKKSAWKSWEVRKARWEWVTALNSSGHRSPGSVGVSLPCWAELCGDTESPSKQQRAGEEELPPLTRHKVHPPASKGAGFCADRAFRGRLNVLLEHLFSLSHKKGWMAIGDQQEMGKDQH